MGSATFCALLAFPHKMVPESALMLESEIKYGKVRKRPDISVVNMNNSIWLVVELKASDVAIDENVWQQALTYGSVLKPKYIGPFQWFDAYFFRVST